MEYINIGSVPCDEECASVGESDYANRSRKECLQFIKAIRQVVGPEVDGARLAVKSFPHDFGSYQEVVCYYDEENEAAAEYAFKCESEAPAKWSDAGMTAPFWVPPVIDFKVVLMTDIPNNEWIMEIVGDDISHGDGEYTLVTPKWLIDRIDHEETLEALKMIPEDVLVAIQV